MHADLSEAVPVRIGRMLLRLAERFGVPADDGAVVIDIPLTQDELAGLTASSRGGTAIALREPAERGPRRDRSAPHHRPRPGWPARAGALSVSRGGSRTASGGRPTTARPSAVTMIGRSMRIGLATITSIHALAVVGQVAQAELLGDRLAHAGDLPRLLAERGEHGVELGRRRRSVEVAALLERHAGLREDVVGGAALGAALVVPDGEVGHGRSVDGARRPRPPLRRPEPVSLAPVGGHDERVTDIVPTFPSAPPERIDLDAVALGPCAGRPSAPRRWRRSTRASTTCRRGWRGPPSRPPRRRWRRSSPPPRSLGPAPGLRLLDRRRRRRGGARRLRAARPARPRRPGDRLLGARRPHRPGHRHGGQPGRSPTPRSPSTGIERVRITCEERNARSARVPEKLGYQFQGVTVPDGGPVRGPADPGVGRRAGRLDDGRRRGRAVASRAWTTARSGCSTAASAASRSPGR